MVDLQIVFVKSKRANVDCGLIVEHRVIIYDLNT